MAISLYKQRAATPLNSVHHAAHYHCNQSARYEACAATDSHCSKSHDTSHSSLSDSGGGRFYYCQQACCTALLYKQRCCCNAQCSSTNNGDPRKAKKKKEFHNHNTQVHGRPWLDGSLPVVTFPQKNACAVNPTLSMCTNHNLRVLGPPPLLGGPFQTKYPSSLFSSGSWWFYYFKQARNSELSLQTNAIFQGEPNKVEKAYV